MKKNYFTFSKSISLKENDIFLQFIFCKDLFKILSKVKNLKNLKLITGQTDHNVNKNLFSYKPSCIKDWYSINVDYSNLKFTIHYPIRVS